MPNQAKFDESVANKLEQRLRVEWRQTVLVLALLTFFLAYFSQAIGLKRVDHLLYGGTMAWATHPASDDIVIVALDDAAIQEFGYWPWRRAVHAQLLKRLEAAKVVGLDIVLSTTNPVYPQDDETLAQAMQQHGRVVVPLVIEHGRVDEPLPVLAQAAADMGYINVQPDQDSVVRSLTLQGTVNDTVHQHFIIAMQRAAGLDPALNEHDRSRLPKLISYAGPAATYQMYPYARVLDGSIPAETFRDKYVLVGAWATALGDVLPVPLSHDGEPMAGVEILANGLQNALEHRWIHTPNRLQTALLSVIPVLLVCVALRRLSPRQSFFVALCIVAAIGLINWLLMLYADFWIGPAAAMVGILLAYPLWGWRSQQATLKQVDAELDHLYEQNLMHDHAPRHPYAAPLDGSLPARLVKLHKAIGTLRHAVAQREETLRFLSHDMRSPQNAILALTQLQRRGQAPLSQDELLNRVDQNARRTVGLVEGFVRLARAESQALRCHQIDLSDLVHSVCDDRWSLAKQRDIQLKVKAPADPIFIYADGDLVSRAVGNLVDNAINYSANGTNIGCRVYLQQHACVVAVSDKGRGMTAIQLTELFEPFRRFDADAPDNPEGSGLGLAFVRTVMMRHGGRVEVQSEPGHGSEFRLVFLSPEARA